MTYLYLKAKVEEAAAEAKVVAEAAQKEAKDTEAIAKEEAANKKAAEATEKEAHTRITLLRMYVRILHTHTHRSSRRSRPYARVSKLFTA